MLRAANGTLIDVFETGKFREVDLGLGRTYPFNFNVAAVPTAILGADFLRRHGLMPDLRAARLVDTTTHLSVDCSGASRKVSTAIVHITVEGDRLLPPKDGKDFQHIRCSPVFRYLCETSGDQRAAQPRDTGALLFAMGQPNSSCAQRQRQHPKTKTKVGCYERLNAITIPDKYPIPDIQTFADRLHRATIFSKIDLARAYSQIRMSPLDQRKTAIITPFGLYEYTRMPFGLRSAAQTFQRLMDAVFRGLPRVFVYIDDILVFSRSPQEHKADLDEVLRRLRKYRMTVRPEKCVFGQAEVEFLGFRLSKAGLQPLPEKVRDLLELPHPTSVAECRRFIGVVNYYHRFIPKLASALLPLYQLANLPKRQCFRWLPVHDKAFQEAKRSLATASSLAFPHPQAPIQVIADASGEAVGAVMQQLQGGRWVPIALPFAQTVRRAAQVEHRRQRVIRPDLQFCTDHKPLTYAFTSKSERSARVQRQLAFLSEFSTNIRHIEGDNNVVSDCLSRPPQVVSAITDDIGLADYKEFAEEQQKSADISDFAANRSLTIERRRVPGTSVPLLVDVSTGSDRPLVPHSLKRSVFERIHNLHHPGVRATKRLLTERFVWQGMSSDIALWCKTL
uniref:RNA-directed DNA polymerase n=1 Tax=Trichuris muris TaxID=70415 RepID=A0A5S6QQZ7_TRIMR